MNKVKVIFTAIGLLLLMISIAYGVTCTAKFDTGTVVTLTATPCPGYKFIVWQGDCSSYGNNPVCQVTMSVDKSVTAIFLPAPTNLRILSVVNWSGEQLAKCGDGQWGYTTKN